MILHKRQYFDMDIEPKVILNNNFSFDLCIDTNFVVNAQVFSCFVGNGSEKCPDYKENIVCHKRLCYKTT